MLEKNNLKNSVSNIESHEVRFQNAHSNSCEFIKVTILPDGRMDAKNAALYLGLSEKTLANKRVNGGGPDFVDRGRIFYFKDQLDNWIQRGLSKNTAQKFFK